MAYLVVLFTDENETAIVPDNWVDKGLKNSWWPPYKGVRVNSAVFKKEVPCDNWAKYPIRVLYTGTWDDTRKRLKRSEDVSDLQSDEEDLVAPAKRPSKVPQRLVSEESSGEDDTPCSPQTPACLTPLRNYPKPPLTLPDRNCSRSQPEPRHQPDKSSPRKRPHAIRQNLSPVPVASASNTTRQIEARDVRVFTMLEKIMDELSDQKRLLKLVLARSADTAEGATLPESVVFPLKTDEDLQQFEDMLSGTQSSTSVVRYLAEFGGHNVKETVNRILREVLATNLALKYNFRGQKGKRAFGSLRLNTILYRCLQRNPATRNCQKKEMEEAVTKWLGGARDREGGRKSRTQTDGRPTVGATAAGSEVSHHDSDSD